MDAQEFRTQRRELNEDFRHVFSEIKTQEFAFRLMRDLTTYCDRNKFEAHLRGLLMDMYTLGALRERVGKHTQDK